MTTKPSDRPPILKFLVLFIGMLVVALGLAALSAAAEVPPPQGAMKPGPAQAPQIANATL